MADEGEWKEHGKMDDFIALYSKIITWKFQSVIRKVEEAEEEDKANVRKHCSYCNYK